MFCLLNTLGPAKSRIITPVIVVITTDIYPFISFIVFTTPFHNILQPIGSHFVPKPTRVFVVHFRSEKLHESEDRQNRSRGKLSGQSQIAIEVSAG